ncbi:MAG: DUF302 domain-containing protein, partial [Planctomycetota bacterium]
MPHNRPQTRDHVQPTWALGSQRTNYTQSASEGSFMRLLPKPWFAAALFFAAVMAITASAPTASADDHGLVTVGPSAHDVPDTLDRLEAALTAKGVTIMARFDHAAGAAKAGLELPPTQVLVFGNPKLGTPLMQAGRSIALDLPMKVVAWADDDGKVWLTYR